MSIERGHRPSETIPTTPPAAAMAKLTHAELAAKALELRGRCLEKAERGAYPNPPFASPAFLGEIAETLKQLAAEVLKPPAPLCRFERPGDGARKVGAPP